MRDAKSIPYSCKISKRQEQKIKFYTSMGINKSALGFIGIEASLQMLEEIYNDFGRDPEKFKQKIKNPPTLYGYTYLVQTLPPEEKLKLQIIRNGKKENTN